jgi:LysM repeat protein
MKLVSRGEWGGPSSIGSSALVRKGMAVHYNGPATGLAAKAHTSCTAYWLGTHRYHVNTNGWSGIGYAWGVCPHGWVYEGRGFDRDQAAQGDPGNQTHQAVQFMVGGTEKPTELMVQAWHDLRTYLRARGVGAEIRPHSSFNSTSCPGDYLRSLITNGTLAASAAPTPPPEEPVPGKTERKTYVVQAGDTLWALSKRFNVTVSQLSAWNNISNADQIVVGRKLYVEAAGAPAPVTPKTAPAPAHDYTRVSYSGRTVNVRTRIMLDRAAKILGRDSLPLAQGSYSTTTSASAGTHAGGGVVDVSSSSWEWAKALRQVGFAAWVRTPSEGQWPYHIHAVAIGDKQLSSSAANQENAYFNGRNALANNRADTAPEWVGRPYPDWAQSYR